MFADTIKKKKEGLCRKARQQADKERMSVVFHCADKARSLHFKREVCLSVSHNIDNLLNNSHSSIGLSRMGVVQRHSDEMDLMCFLCTSES
ncbi:hypothetical protein CEXT_432381 [Caerostris extrusa]|uniref:Uncharacterized protein n=1 Tax=Caerostris extrusa TaxID=172846 RepID=A0AAV4Q9S4_CAEEX|nr:hypothetical protein CEXT_432381 [Caerostris extrusa]